MSWRNVQGDESDFPSGPESTQNPYREPDERERERKRIIIGRITTAFGHKVPGGDAAARESGEWVVNGYPWIKPYERTLAESQVAAVEVLCERWVDQARFGPSVRAESGDVITGCIAQLRKALEPPT